MVRELLALREAPALDPYTGPAILAPEAAGVLFHEAVGHRLEGERQNDDKDGKTFKGQVGKPILPHFLTILDDPTMKQLGATSVNGHYAFDDQGVAGQRTVLVQNGVLRTFLLSRAPVQGFSNSNGHGRSSPGRDPVARMSNLIVESSKTMAPARLKEALLAEVRRQEKPFGLLIRDVTGGNTDTSGYAYQAFKGQPRLVYKVDAKTGQETLVRGVEIVGTPLTSINKIIATADDSKVFNGYCGAESGFAEVGAYPGVSAADGASVVVLEFGDVARSPIHRTLRVLDIEARRFGGDRVRGQAVDMKLHDRAPAAIRPYQDHRLVGSLRRPGGDDRPVRMGRYDSRTWARSVPGWCANQNGAGKVTADANDPTRAVYTPPSSGTFPAGCQDEVVATVAAS